jgi:sugar O-acyltransferase (sialic acid O-acetyltransferase NeuD family)
MKSDKRALYLVGAGAFSRELASWISMTEPGWSDFEFAGFLEDNPAVLDNYPGYNPGIVSSIGDFQPREGDALVMGIADPKAKLAVAALLESRGAVFKTFIHPSALLARHVSIGKGVVICPNVVVSCHAKIGDFVGINLGSTVGHDVVVGDGCTLSAHVDLTGFTNVGAGAFFGTHACTLPRAKIGAGAKVGAGSVVLRSAAVGASVMGVPAKQILP